MKRRTRALLVACGIAVAAPAMNAEYVVASPVDDQRRGRAHRRRGLADLGEQADILAEDYVVAVDEEEPARRGGRRCQGQGGGQGGRARSVARRPSEVAVRAFTGAGGDVLGPCSRTPPPTATRCSDISPRVALSVGTATTDDLDALIADLEAERADLADKLEAAESLTETIAEAQAATEELTAEYKAQRAAAEAKLGDLIVEEEARRAAESARQLARDAAARPPPRRAPAARSAAGLAGDPVAGPMTVAVMVVAGMAAVRRRRHPHRARRHQRRPLIRSTTLLRRRWRGPRIAAAMGQLGVPYVRYTSSPGVSFDCSGLTSYAWGQAGVYLPHQSRAQAAMLPHAGERRPGR